ncbi:hypothetical protein D6C00_14185 [Thiohalobacter thiocyanaticus]|uniref:Terminase large subunit n=1 Tax=Thiohalobacter thiocyanaticus TaxID=585455 RepID=A0A426QDR2_9GAMM|nr:hypothetical protein D6C00_14185 [Thiohalobacter thiocyanaticus]
MSRKKWDTVPDGSVDNADLRRFFSRNLRPIARRTAKAPCGTAGQWPHTLVFPEERGSGIVLAATKEQAGLVYDGMASTVEADQYLQKQFQVRRYRSDILHRDTGTVLKAVSTELHSTVGTAPSFFVVDELHLLGANQRGSAMVRQLSSGMSVREHPMGIYITTAPLGVASGVYAAMVSRARRILEGKADNDRMLPVLFEMPEDADLDNPELWWMPNPSLGTTINREWLEQEHRIAKADPDPFALTNFYSQHLNVHAQERIGVDRWLPLDEWDKHADPDLTLERVVRESRYLFAAVDAGGRDDPSVLLVMGQTKGGDYLVWAHQWLHRDGYLKRRETVPYAEFEAAGDLTVFDEPDADITAITSKILDLSPVNTAVDPYGLKTLVETLERRGRDVTGIPQGWKLSPHIDYTERLIYAGRITHHGGPMLRWNIGNARAEDRHGARSMTKPSGASVGPEKIDGCLCLIMACAIATDHRPSAYEEHGIRVL